MENSRWNKQMRLHRPEDFRKVRSKGRSWAHPWFILCAAPNGLERTRVGITASRRVGNAVARNRARRLLKESTRRLYSQMTRGWDVVLVARAGLEDAREPIVRDALRVMLERANLLATKNSAEEESGRSIRPGGACLESEVDVLSVK